MKWGSVRGGGFVKHDKSAPISLIGQGWAPPTTIPNERPPLISTTTAGSVIHTSEVYYVLSGGCWWALIGMGRSNTDKNNSENSTHTGPCARNLGLSWFSAENDTKQLRALCRQVLLWRLQDTRTQDEASLLENSSGQQLHWTYGWAILRNSRHRPHFSHQQHCRKGKTVIFGNKSLLNWSKLVLKFLIKEIPCSQRTRANFPEMSVSSPPVFPHL